jgi:O-antigen/teichoic acid export membrane protein
MREDDSGFFMKEEITVATETRTNLVGRGQQLYGRVLENQYLRQNVLLLMTNVLAGIFAYLLHPFLGRIMSIQQYGQVATFIALSLVLATPTQIIATIAAKHVSTLSIEGDQARINDFLRRLTVLLLGIGVGVTALFMLASGYIASFFHLGAPREIVLLSLIFVVTFATPLNQGTLQGMQRFGWYAAISLLVAFLRLVLSIGFVLLGLGVDGAVLGIVLSAILTYLISFVPLWGILRGSRERASGLRDLWGYSLLTALTATGLVLLSSIDTILAKHFLSAADAGLYAGLATIGRTVLFVTNSIAVIMFPRVVMLHQRGESHTRILLQSVLGALALTAIAEVAFCLEPVLITRVLFGVAFVSVAGLLPLYGLAMLLLSLAQVVAMYFLAIGNRLFVGIILLACLLQIGLIAWRHSEIGQVVQGIVLSDAALVVLLLVLWLVVFRRSLVRARLVPVE